MFYITLLNVKAQLDSNIIYYDFNPDTLLIPFETLSIDINQDSVNDLNFYFIYPSEIILQVTSLNTNCNYAFISNSYNDSLTNSMLTWHTGAYYWNWDWNIERLGIKYSSNTDTYYGWLHGIALAEYPPKLIVDKFAFCKIANYPFLWGQTEIITSIASQESNDSTVVYVSDSGSGVVVQSSKTITNVSLTNIQGVVVSSQSYINSGNATISTAGFAHGTYIVQVKFSDGGVYTKQVVL